MIPSGIFYVVRFPINTSKILGVNYDYNFCDFIKFGFDFVGRPLIHFAILQQLFGQHTHEELVIERLRSNEGVDRVSSNEWFGTLVVQIRIARHRVGLLG